jgi:DNA (cytosine-5)-methyltransferase 1
MFAGIGGFDLGFERAGLNCAWQIEIDEFCQKVLQKNWPNVYRWDDVTTFNPDGRDVDVLVAGFPCQDISSAGKKEGLNGKRSGLFFEVIRVARHIKPKAIVLENVSAMLNRTMGDVLGSLAGIGYDSQWHSIQALQFGAPHRRKRVFVIATLADSNCERGCGRHTERENAENAWESPRCEKSRFWNTEPSVGRVANGVPRRVDRLRSLGNAVVPQVAESIANLTISILNNQKCSI